MDILPIILITIGYLLGSLCSAIIVSKMFNLPDPRTHGSHNPGATNILRLAGKKYALIVLLVDIIKGFIPVFIAQHLTNVSDTVVALIAVAAVLGHMFPIFFNFVGGKGVATAIGSILGFNLLAGFFTMAVWFLVALLSKRSSIASLLSITISPVVVAQFSGDMNVFSQFMVIVLFIYFQHRNNIIRLFDGTEPKIDIKKDIDDL